MARAQGLVARIGKFFFGGEWAKGFARHLRPILIIGTVIGTLTAGLYLLDAFNQFENRTLDWRFLYRDVRESAFLDKIVIVEYSNQFLNAYNLIWPIPRGFHAKLIDRLSEAGAQVIAVDLVLSEKGDPKQDQLLSEAISRSRSWIILGGQLERSISDIAVRRELIGPSFSVDPAKSHLGLVNQSKDDDGVARGIELVKLISGKRVFQFDLKIIERFLRLDPGRTSVVGDVLNFDKIRIPAEGGVKMMINYVGPSGSFKKINADNILDDSVYPNLKKAGIFKDKLVYLGPTFAEAQDMHSTPFSATSGQMSGVEIHANILDTLLNQAYLIRLPKLYSVLWIFFLTFLCVAVSIRLRPLFGPLVMLLLISGALVFVTAAFVKGNLVVPLVIPSLAIVLSTLATISYRVLVEERRGHQIKAMFSRYVSPKVVEELVKNPKGAMTLGGNKQIVTVLFSDIRNFTTMSEQLKPEEVVELLNEYFQDMTDVIFSHDGTVDKFIGDAIMAVFGAPVEHEDDPLRAVKSGLDMLKALEKLNAAWSAQGRRTIAIGVGVNTGEAIVGNMGSTQAMGYTVIGDTVNLASRLEGLNKELKTSLLISENTYRYVRDHVEVQAYSGVKVKGKAEEMTVYEVLGLKS